MTFKFDSVNRNVPQKEIRAKALQKALAVIYEKAGISESHQVKLFDQLLELSKDIPASSIIAPDPLFGVELLKASDILPADDARLSAYTGLLLSSLNKDTALDAHPAYVQILKQLTSDEIKILWYCTEQKRVEYPFITVVSENSDTGVQQLELKHYSNLAVKAECQFSGLTPVYLENMARLGLAQFEENVALSDESLYLDILNSDYIQKVIQDITAQKKQAKHAKGIFSLTNLGMMFCGCIHVVMA